MPHAAMGPSVLIARGKLLVSEPLTSHRPTWMRRIGWLMFT